MKVIITPQARKQYKKLSPKYQKRVKGKMIALEDNPHAGKALLGKLKGLRSLRVWPYRVIYTVNTQREDVWIVSILHRQGAY